MRTTCLIAADPADAPTRVLGFTLQWGDPLASSPTGLVLAFSGPIDVNSLMGAVKNQAALRVVDQVGQRLGPDAQRLPGEPGPGELRLRSASPARPVHSPRFVFERTDRPRGPDAGFARPASRGSRVVDHTAPARTAAAGNLGVVWPSLPGGVSQSGTIAPGPWIVNRVVAPVTGLYTLETNVTQGTLAVRRQGADGSVVIDPGSQGPSHTYMLYPRGGRLQFQLRAVGPETVKAVWQLKPSAFDWESLIDNGVAQTAALSLRFLTFDSSSLTPGLPPGLIAVRRRA